MVNINEYIKALLHQAGGHQGSHNAHQAGNQSHLNMSFNFLHNTSASDKSVLPATA